MFDIFFICKYTEIDITKRFRLTVNELCLTKITAELKVKINLITIK